MDKILTYKGAVMTWECDSNRHMNVMYYINKFEHAGRNFDLELGLHQEDSNSDTGVVVLEQHVHYLKEVFEDDLLYIESALVDIARKTFTVRHEMYNARTEQLVAKMKVVLVPFDKILRKSLAFPEEQRLRLIQRWQLV